MKRILNSDWLRAVQFKGNTSANSVTPVQIKKLMQKYFAKKMYNY